MHKITKNSLQICTGGLSAALSFSLTTKKGKSFGAAFCTKKAGTISYSKNKAGQTNIVTASH